MLQLLDSSFEPMEKLQFFFYPFHSALNLPLISMIAELTTAPQPHPHPPTLSHSRRASSAHISQKRYGKSPYLRSQIIQYPLSLEDKISLSFLLVPSPSFHRAELS